MFVSGSSAISEDPDIEVSLRGNVSRPCSFTRANGWELTTRSVFEVDLEDQALDELDFGKVVAMIQSVLSE
jgi:hypothetical protein